MKKGIKSLSDKIHYKKLFGEMQDLIPEDLCFVSDIKEAVKRLKEIVLESLDPRIDPPLFAERIDEIFGDKLI